jgi:hypothetical protein
MGIAERAELCFGLGDLVADAGELRRGKRPVFANAAPVLGGKADRGG